MRKLNSDKKAFSKKSVFWQALILAIFLFFDGVLIGVLIENSRTGKVSEYYTNAEIDLLDIRLQQEIYSVHEINCVNAIEENINFADRIFYEARKLDKYESAQRITEDIILQHKKYDLLRTLFWLNSIEIKKRCNASYHNVVYIYQYNKPSLDTKSKQAVFSNALSELKGKIGHEIMLIPIAGDNNLTSVNLLMNAYNISQSELPVVLIDEKIKITDISDISDIEKVLS